LADASNAEAAMTAAAATKAMAILRTMIASSRCYTKDELFVGTAPLVLSESRAPRPRAKISTTESIGQD